MPEERDRLLFLLPEPLRQLAEAPACAGMLLRLFSGSPEPWDPSSFSFGTAALMETALLLREEAEHFSPQAAEALAHRINQTIWDLYGENSYVYEMLLLYEIVYYYQGQPGAPVIPLYRDALEPCLDTLTQIDGASVSDLLLIVAALLREDKARLPEARTLLERCVVLRQACFEERSPFLMAARGSLMDLCYAMGDADGALEESRILLRQPENDLTRPILCHARLLAADILLDRLDTAGVADHLRRTGALLRQLPAEADPDRRLRFRQHTAWARYYFSSAEEPSGLSRMELHAKQAYLLARQEKYSGEDVLVAINNLLYPLAYSSQDREAVRLVREAAGLIDAEGLHHTRAAAIVGVTARLFGLDGVILMAFLLGFPANEIVLPVMLMAYLSTGTILELDDLGALHGLLTEHGWTWVTAVCTMLFSLFHWPCSTTCLTIARETGSLKWTLLSMAIPTGVGLAVCFCVASLGRLAGVA